MQSVRLALLLILGALALPTAASALTVTVTVHGAGGVSETLNSFDETRSQGPCLVDPDGMTPTDETVCVLGSEDGFWNAGDLVRLSPYELFEGEQWNAGWRFDKWVDGTDPGQVDCNPQDAMGGPIHPSLCEFEITEDASIDLYFKDVGGPNTYFYTQPFAEFTNTNTGTFEFYSNTDPDATFECKLDGPAGAGEWAACGDPDPAMTFTKIPDGSYTFSVRGIDINGNIETTPATSTWLLDTVKPTGTVTFPTFYQYLSVDHFTPLWSISDTNLKPETIRCALDYDNDVPCDEVTGLSEGQHRFAVGAWDCCANRGGGEQVFIVDLVAPNTKIVSGPSGDTTSRTVTFKFRESNPEYGDVYFKCSLDGGAWKSCSSPKSYSVARGRHVLKIKAKDQVGHVETTPAVRKWRRI
jgi:hypothetical protein